MATPSARFVIDFTANTSGIDQTKSSLDSLKGSITADTNALKEMADAMNRLKGTAEVIRWEALPRDISKAENEVAKFAAKMAKLKADFAAAPDGKKEGIFAASLQTGGELEKATARLRALKGERDKLSQTAPVKLFEDLKAGADKLKSRLGENQVALSRMGGTMGGVKESANAMKDLAAGAEAAGAPTAGLVSKLKALKALGVAGWIAVAVAGLALLAAGIGAAVVKAVSFSVSMADAARSARLLREASAGSAEAAQGLYDATLRIEEKTGAQRDEVVALANEYARLKMSMGAVEGATTAITIASKTMGDQVGSTIKGIIDRGKLSKLMSISPYELRGTGIALRDVAVQLVKGTKNSVAAAETALKQGVVKMEDGAKALGAAFEASPLGAIAKKQALALGVQFERAKANIGRLFDGVKIEGFLEKLNETLGLFKETSDTGKALKESIAGVFQPFVDAAEGALPDVEAMVWELATAIQEIRIGIIKAGGVQGVFGDMKGKAEDLWGVLKGIASALQVIAHPLDSMWEKFKFEGDKGIKYEVIDTGVAEGQGLAITAGIAKGVRKGTAEPVSAIVAMSDAMKAAFSGPKGIDARSPSKAFEKRAIQAPAGVVKGIDAGKPAVARALSSLADPSDMNTQRAPATTANSSEARSFNVTLNYYGRGSRREASELRQWLSDELETLTLAKGLPA